MRVIVCFFVSFFISNCAISGDGHSLRVQAAEIVVKPACNQYCNGINTVYLDFVSKTKKDTGVEKQYFLKKLNDVIEENKYEKKIKIISSEKSTERKWIPFIPTAIRIEVVFVDIVSAKSSFNVIIKMVTPSGAYHNLLTCEKNSEFLSDEIDAFFSVMISDFLFNQSILAKDQYN